MGESVTFLAGDGLCRQGQRGLVAGAPSTRLGPTSAFSEAR